MENEIERKGIDPLKEKFNLFPVWKHLAFFIVGWLGLKILDTIIGTIVVLIYNANGIDLTLKEFAKENVIANMIVNISCYTLLTISLLLICGKPSLKELGKQFKNKNAIIDGIAYGAFLLIASGAVAMLINLIRGGDNTVNDNQAAIELMTRVVPVPMFIMTVIFAPICEEITYRLGLFNVLRRKNRWLAYVCASLIFAFIHFTIPEKGETFNANLANEFWNIPSYIVSGVILCRAYEKHQSIATSMIAHAINNFVAIVMTIISVFLG